MEREKQIAKGDIIYNSWGYDQTNNDWYEVIECTGKTVKLQQIGAKYVEDGWYCGHSEPNPEHKIGEPIRKRINKWGWLSFEFGGMSFYENKPVYESHYA